MASAISPFSSAKCMVGEGNRLFKSWKLLSFDLAAYVKLTSSNEYGDNQNETVKPSLITMLFRLLSV